MRSGFLVRWFNGEISLWKAIVLLQIAGWLVLVFTIGLTAFIFPFEIVRALKIVLLPCFALYSSVCVFRASPNPKESIKGALAKLWSVFFAVYGLAVTYYLVTQ